jgi:hypothetical protein
MSGKNFIRWATRAAEGNVETKASSARRQISSTLLALSCLAGKVRSHWPLLSTVSGATLSAVPLILFCAGHHPVNDSLAIVFIARTGTHGFDQMHEHLLEHLVTKHNSSVGKAISLRFEKLDARAGVDPIKNTARLREIYKGIARRSDVIAVIDNSWGEQMKGARKEIRGVSSPVIFLNGDSNGLEFGDGQSGRLFLGDSGVAVDQIQTMLATLLGDRRAASRDSKDPAPAFVFIGEKNYELNAQYVRAIESDNELKSLRFTSKDRIDLNGPPPAEAKTKEELKRSEAEVQRVQNELRARLLGLLSDKSKLILLSCHKEWGKQLLPWIDETFGNAMVVGHQSINSRGSFPFVSPTNQLVIFGQSPRAAPEVLIAELRYQQDRFAKLYGKPDDLLYVRRCFAAMDLITRPLIAAEKQYKELHERHAQTKARMGGLDHKSLIKTLNSAIRSYAGRRVESSLGRLSFDEHGRELGNNHILFYRGNKVFSYSKQLNSKGKMVPNIQFGFMEMKLGDVNVSTRTFHADFFFWVRCPDEYLAINAKSAKSQEDGSAIQQAVKEHKSGQDSNDGGAKSDDTNAPEEMKEEKSPAEIGEFLMKRLVFSNHASDSFQAAVVSSEKIGNTWQSVFNISGVFTAPVQGGWYPFDTQRLAISFRVSEDDDTVRISPDEYGADPSGRVDIDVDGWRILDKRLTVESTATDQVLIPLEDLDKALEFNRAILSFDVRRRFWNPALRILCPLFLLTLASLAVLFIKVPLHVKIAGQEASDAQSALTLTCMLAVVTYLISYAALAPRLALPTMADVLVCFTLVVSVLNFVFCVAISKRTSRWYWRMLTIERYRYVAAATSIALFTAWSLFAFVP